MSPPKKVNILQKTRTLSHKKHYTIDRIQKYLTHKEMRKYPLSRVGVRKLFQEPDAARGLCLYGLVAKNSINHFKRLLKKSKEDK